MRWTWEVVLQISTFLGGLAAVVFFYDRYKSRERAKSLREVEAKKRSPSSEGLSDVLAKRQALYHTRKTDLRAKFKDWGIRWTAIHFFVSSICFGLVSFWLGFGGQAIFSFFGGIPSLLMGYILRKANHEDAYDVFSSGALFSMGGGFLAFMFTCLLCLATGDPNGDHIASSGIAILSGLFCFLEAVVCTYLMVRWA